MVEVHGTCDERFASLEEAFRQHLEAGTDRGASLAATLHGQMVVDLWGGTRDYGQAEPWEADTLVRVFSTSKVMVMLVVLMLVDQGRLDLDQPISSYWPEFAQEGKEAITVRQVLLHQSGLPGFGRKLTFEELRHWDLLVRVVEQASLWYEPGTISCYHAQVFGVILGELVRRLSGFPFDEFFRRELAEPLGADFHFSLGPSEVTRVAALWPAAGQLEFPTEMGERVMSEILGDKGEWIDPEFLSLMLPASTGLTNARALARIGAVVACGGDLDSRHYLSRRIIAEAGREQSFKEDQLMGWLRLGLGFGLDSEGFPAPTPTTIHWGGYGGSFLTMDPESGISCGFAPNQLMIGEKFGDDPRMVSYWSRLGEISAKLA